MAIFTVLGASGFIGKRLTHYLRDQGHSVNTPSRGSSAIFDQDLGHVMYCIGLTTDYWQRLLDTVEAHVCVLNNILRDARFERLVYLSSTRLYDGLDGDGTETRELTFDPLFARHVYDLSKSLGEALAHHAGRPAVVARIANVYDDALERDDFFCNLIQRALKSRSFTITASAETGRDYIHVDDVVRALEAIALHGKEKTYNVASGVLFNNRDLVGLLKHEWGCDITLNEPAATKLPPRLDVSRLCRDFSLQPLPPAERLPSLLRMLRPQLSDGQNR